MLNYIGHGISALDSGKMAYGIAKTLRDKGQD